MACKVPPNFGLQRTNNCGEHIVERQRIRYPRRTNACGQTGRTLRRRRAVARR
jgi:hypothetical protein